MEKKVVLSLSERVGFTLSKVETEELDEVISAKITDKRKSVKKIIKLCRDRDIIISKRNDKAEIFKNIKRKRNCFSPDLIIPVINKICRQASLKFGYSMPYEEIYIVAEQSFALFIIEQIKDLARLFIVVSPKEADSKLYDRFYFEHSAMVRQCEIMPKTVKEDSMIIAFQDYSLPLKCKSPFINFTDKKAGVCNEVYGKKIYVSDASMKEIEEQWGGNSGLALFELFGVKTGQESTVDINNCADDIFLLDMTGF